MPRPIAALMLALACVLPAGGCKLIDQTTFGAPPVPPAPDQLAEATQSDGRIPLVTIRFDQPGFAYQAALRQAVEEAEARIPGVHYIVTTVVPARGDPAVQATLAEQSQADAQAVVTAMEDDGAAADHISLAASTDPAVTAREVQIFVRKPTVAAPHADGHS